MFDDVQPPKSGTTPPNLPLGELEDMFEHTDSVPDSSETSIPAPVVNTALNAGVLKPKTNTDSIEDSSTPPRSTSSTPTTSPTYTLRTPSAPFLAEEQGAGQIPQSAEVPQEAPFSGGKILGLVITLAVLILLGFGSLYIYTSFIKNNATENNNFITPDTVTTPDTTPDTTSDTNTSSTNTTEDTILFGEPVDTDSDGVSDVDEAGYGTNTLNWDTDADELSDGDEIMIWRTDPLIFDTDRDGYGDGVEIKNGYNPLDTGKLFETPTSTSGSSTTSP